MSRISACALCFLSGFVVCANLSRLVPTNGEYEASFLNVAIAFTIGLSAAIWEESK